MNTHLLNRLLLVLLVSQGLIGCKTSTDSGTSTDTPKSSDSNSGQSVSTQPTPTPTPTPSTGGETTGGGSTTPVVPPSTPAQVCDGAVAGTLDAGTISINSGAALTNNFQVTLALNKAFAKDMKISNSADCSCGSWETYATSKTWTLANPNAMDTISVQFRDYEGSVSLCATASIVHDNAAPQISVTADPKNSNLTGTNNVFNYQATDAGAGVKSVTCSIDGQAVACSGSSGQITASNLGAGSHTVSVAAVDNLNQSTEAHVSFVITSPYRNITQNKSITAENKVDILIVVDNSPSMQDVQKNMASRVSSLLSQVKDLDYHIAVTTTDPTNKVTGDGMLLPFTGASNLYVLTPAVAFANAQVILANTIQRPEIGSATEEGIYATYRVIERSLAGEVNPKNFFRSDAAFSVILISDADESAKGFKNIPANLINLVKTNWPAKKFNFNSVIVRPGDTACLRSGRENYGPTYDALSRLLGYGTTGGSIIGTVCATDYGAQLTGIGQSVQQMIKTMDLDCAPIGGVNSSVVVQKDGSAYTDAYEVQGLKIVFQNNLPAGNYTLSYKCN